MADNVAASAELRSWLYYPVFSNDWTRQPLYSLAQWVNGLAFREIQFSETGMPVIKIAEIKGEISGQTRFTKQIFDESVHVRPGDLLFSWSGQPETSIDVFWWRGPEGWLNQHSFRVTPTKYIDSTFFYYLLRYLKPNFIGIARNKQTTGLGHVTKRDLENIEAAYPDMSEQRAIAHILGTLDDKIELNRQMNQTLEAMAQALFKSWFVDFEPFCDQGMQDSPLGKILVGWRVGKLEGIAYFVKGVSYRSDDLQESDVALVTLKSVAKGGGYQPEGLKPYIGEYGSEQELRPGEVVVAHTDLTQKAEVLGRAARVQVHPKVRTLVASLDLVIVRPIEEKASNEFLYGLLSRDEFQEHAYAYANGTTVLHLSAKALPQYQCVLPSPNVIDNFTKLVRPIYGVFDNNEIQNGTLSALRDALLPKLLSGELRVKDAEKFIKEGIT